MAPPAPMVWLSVKELWELTADTEREQSAAIAPPELPAKFLVNMKSRTITTDMTLPDTSTAPPKFEAEFWSKFTPVRLTPPPVSRARTQMAPPDPRVAALLRNRQPVAVRLSPLLTASSRTAPPFSARSDRNESLVSDRLPRTYTAPPALSWPPVQSRMM